MLETTATKSETKALDQKKIYQKLAESQREKWLGIFENKSDNV